MKVTTKKPQRQVRNSRKSETKVSDKFIADKRSTKERNAERDQKGTRLIHLQSRLRDLRYEIERLSLRDGTMGLAAVGVSKIDFLVNCAYHDALDRFDTHLKAALVHIEGAENEALNAGYYSVNPLFQKRAKLRHG